MRFLTKTNIATFWIGINLLVFTLDTFARSGGGGSFSGGGGGGSSSGGGGYLVYWAIRSLFYLVIYHPIIGIPLLILIIYIIYKTQGSARTEYNGYRIKKLRSWQTNAQKEHSLSKIKKRDPLFSEKDFLEKCARFFVDFQYQWSEGNLKKSEAVLSDGLFNRLQMNLAIDQASQLKNKMEDVVVLNQEIIGVESDFYFDTLHVSITAKAKDFDVRLGKDKVVKSSSLPFTEIYSFLRRPGAKTLEKGLMEGFCPNCGNPLQVGEATQCPSCKSFIRSGQYDWVLAEITQDTEFRQLENKEVKGLQEFLKKDSSFNRQHIEDRLTVLFWQYHGARFFADKTMIKKWALPSFFQYHQKKFILNDKGERTFFQDLAIGGVDLEEIIIGDENEFDRAILSVSYSGHIESKPLDIPLNREIRDSHYMIDVFHLVRKNSVISSTSQSLTSAHCPGCGAPEVRDDKDECAYCGRLLNDGSGDWVLEKIESMDSYRQHRMDSASSKFILSHVIEMALADGVLDEKEKKYIVKLGHQFDLTKTQTLSFIKDVENLTFQAKDFFATSEEKEKLIEMVINMALIDGRLSSSELKALALMLKPYGLTKATLKKRIVTQRQKLVKQLRAEKVSFKRKS